MLYKNRIYYLTSVIAALTVFSCSSCQSSITPTLTNFFTPIPSITHTLSQEAIQTSDSYHGWNEFQNISISPDGEMIVISAINGMRVYDINTKSLIYSYEYEPVSKQHTGSYTRIAWSSNNEYLAIGTLSEGVRIWRISPWDLVTEILVDAYMPPRPWSHPGFEWSPDGNQLVLGVLTGWDHDEDGAILGRVLVWDSISNLWGKIFDGEVINVTWWDSGQIVIMLEGSMVDITSGVQNTIVEAENIGHYGTVIWSPDERYYCESSEMGGQLYDLKNKESMKRLRSGGWCYPPIAWSIDGRYFARLWSRSEVYIWNTIENVEDTVEIEDAEIFKFAWSPQDDLYVLGAKGESAFVWNTSTDEVVLEVE